MTEAAIFLDRDGVINVDSGYVSHWDDFEFMPCAIQAMRFFLDKGYLLVVVTNQSGIGRGYYTEADFCALTESMRGHLSREGVDLSGVYFCPHHTEATIAEYRMACDCRKPEPGMLLRAAQELNIDLSRSVMVGDKSSDMIAAQRAGITQRFHVTDTLGHKGCVAVRDLAEVCDYLR
jgi:D-glycero-D-manno-heptose 1,7-bisphosphate phosphatase